MRPGGESGGQGIMGLVSGQPVSSARGDIALALAGFVFLLFAALSPVDARASASPTSPAVPLANAQLQTQGQADRKPWMGTQIFLCNKPGLKPNNELVLLEYEKRLLLVSTSRRLPGKEKYFSCSWGNGGALFQSVRCLAALPGNENLWQLSLSYNKVGNKRTLQGVNLKPDRGEEGGRPLHLGSYTCEITQPGKERGRDE